MMIVLALWVLWIGKALEFSQSCFLESEVAEPLFTLSEQHLSLRELRRQIMFDMEPGLSQVDSGEVRLALVSLH
jgi:hypothetical protein